MDNQTNDRARNLWEAGWRQWEARELSKPSEKQNRFLVSQILMYLARLEFYEGNRDLCVRWLEALVPFRFNPEEIVKRIAEAKAGLPLESANPAN